MVLIVLCSTDAAAIFRRLSPQWSGGTSRWFEKHHRRTTPILPSRHLGSVDARSPDALT
jgi:hypothetical protein